MKGILQHFIPKTLNIKVIVLMLLCGITQPALAVDKTWTGDVSQAWSNPNNWSPVGVPAQTDAVIINPLTTYELIITNEAIVRSAGTQVLGTLTITTNGQMTITNSSHFVIRSEGQMVLNDVSAQFLLYGNTTMSVEPDATFNNYGYVVNYGTIGNSGTFTNNGYYCSGTGGTGSFVGTLTHTLSAKIGGNADTGCLTFSNLSTVSGSKTIFGLTNSTATACNDFMRINVTGAAVLAGTFEVTDNNNDIGVGNEYIVMTYGSKSGTFSNTSFNMGVNVNGQRYANISYTATQAKITISSTVLPVELTHFAAHTEGGKNVLTWQTATERDNKLFEIERSIDGRVFHSLAQFKAANKPNAYQYVDAQPFRMTYYRLKQIDNDGTETYSKVVSIERNDKAKGLKVYPSVVSDHLTVETDLIEDYQVFNTLGQVVLRGAATRQIDVSGLGLGTYWLKIGESVSKFMKQ